MRDQTPPPCPSVRLSAYLSPTAANSGPHYIHIWYNKLNSSSRMRLNIHVLIRLQTLHIVMVKTDILHTVKRTKINCKGHIRRRNCLLNHTIARKKEETMKGRGNDEDEVSSYCMTLRKRYDTGN